MTPNGPTRKQEGDHGGLTTKVGYIGDMKVVDATSSYRADVGQTVLKTIKCDSTFTLQQGTWNHLRLRKEMFSVFDMLFAEILAMFREVTINTLRAGGLMLLVVALLAVLRNI